MSPMSLGFTLVLATTWQNCQLQSGAIEEARISLPQLSKLRQPTLATTLFRSRRDPKHLTTSASLKTAASKSSGAVSWTRHDPRSKKIIAVKKCSKRQLLRPVWKGCQLCLTFSVLKAFSLKEPRLALHKAVRTAQQMTTSSYGNRPTHSATGWTADHDNTCSGPIWSCLCTCESCKNSKGQRHTNVRESFDDAREASFINLGESPPAWPTPSLPQIWKEYIPLQILQNLLEQGLEQCIPKVCSKNLRRKTSIQPLQGHLALFGWAVTRSRLSSWKRFRNDTHLWTWHQFVAKEKVPSFLIHLEDHSVFFSDLWSQKCKRTTEYNYKISFEEKKIAKVPSEGSCPTPELMWPAMRAMRFMVYSLHDGNTFATVEWNVFEPRKTLSGQKINQHKQYGCKLCFRNFSYLDFSSNWFWKNLDCSWLWAMRSGDGTCIGLCIRSFQNNCPWATAQWNSWPCCLQMWDNAIRHWGRRKTTSARCFGGCRLQTCFQHLGLRLLELVWKCFQIKSHRFSMVLAQVSFVGADVALWPKWGSLCWPKSRQYRGRGTCFTRPRPMPSTFFLPHVLSTSGPQVRVQALRLWPNKPKLNIGRSMPPMEMGTSHLSKHAFKKKTHPGW